MVRVSIKGGIWKNSEDEILKAAVQKYGKQQWARVASLLNRKTAKQAKARWHEWLDPAIKKTTDWSREEEEKLLHLAKLLPAQWRTIGPLVGNRTANQCQEHYEYLLDQAAAAASGDGDAATTANLRKTDAATAIAHPETKPARPDPIDMDEDELEMLQEARARLANTQGKKAKRKERERMLAQAKRLADLQKRRELKQAGLLSEKARTKACKRSRDIDLGVEIPFHKPAPAGFHDVSSEDARAESIRQKRWKAVDYNQINQQQYKTRDREAAQLQKREQARLRLLEQSNDKYATAAAQQAVDDTPSRPRISLQLPAPEISERDRREYEKLEQQQKRMQKRITGDSNGVTAALLGDYTDRPLPTPLLRSNTASSSKRMDLVQTATQLRQLQEGQTPLLPATSAANPEDDEMDQNDETKKSNNNKLPAVPPGASRGKVATAATPLVSSRRDELGLNEPDGTMSVSTFATDARSLAKSERKAVKRAREELSAALSSLPAPQYEYELDVPSGSTNDMDDEDTEVKKFMKRSASAVAAVPDRADVEEEQREAKRTKIVQELERRSTVLRRSDLPRPPPAQSSETLKTLESLLLTRSDSFSKDKKLETTTSTKEDDDGNGMDDSEIWYQQVHNEMQSLLAYDAKEYPTKKKKKSIQWGSNDASNELQKSSKGSILRHSKVPKVAPLEQLPQKYLDEAKEAITLEMENSKEVVLFGNESDSRGSSSQDGGDMYYLPDLGWTSDVGEDNERIIQSLKLEFETLQSALKEIRTKHDKMALKAKVVHGGYEKRAQLLQSQLQESFTALQAAQIEHEVFSRFAQQEQGGAQQRVKELSTRIRNLKQLEMSLQRQYGALTIEKRRRALRVAQSQNQQAPLHHS